MLLLSSLTSRALLIINTLLHFTKEKRQPQPALLCTTATESFLATAQVIVRHNNKQQIFKSIIDPGSTATFISENLANTMGLQRKKGTTRYVTIAGSMAPPQLDVATINIEGLKTNYTTSVQAVIVPSVVPPQPTNIIKNSWPHIIDLPLADPSFTSPSEIDLLLGCDIYADIVEADIIRGTAVEPIAIKTKLGFIIMGKMQETIATQPPEQPCLLTTAWDDDLRRLWNQDSDTEKTLKVLTPEEEECVNHFNHNTKRDSDGRFVVSLPLKEEAVPQLSNTLFLAKHRFLRLEKQLKKDTNLHEAYREQIQYYKNNNFIEKVPKSDIKNDSYYLPHHAVIKNNSTTTKVRVVFDGSASTKQCASINSIMLNGPRVQDTLFDIITRWRSYPIGLCTDIEKMYLQIKVHSSHHDYQRVLWRDSPQDPIHHMRLTRLTFGLKAAPFIATKCLEVLADEEQLKYPRAAEILKSNFYVDDGMFGAHSLQEATELQTELTQLLATAGFTPRKWASNSPFLFFKDNDRTKNIQLEAISTLGLKWLPEEDAFQFHIQQPIPVQVTKRQALSQAARLFDPLNWLGPVTVIPKIFLQTLWKLKIGWDEPVPQKLSQEWRSYVQSLDSIAQIRIPRFLGTHADAHITLHGFADASERAYGAVIYARTRVAKNISSTIIAAKNRVAPVKLTTIPRLELSAAVLLVRLMNMVQHALKLENVECHYYTDSTIVLAWIAEPAYNWQTFIANRVATIHDNSSRNQWRHVPSAQNPADKLSRGCSPSELIHDTQWWNGPTWLTTGPEPKQPPIVPAAENRKIVAAVTAIKPFRWESDADNLTSVCNSVAFAIRFLRRQWRNNPIDADEFQEALTLLIRLSQNKYMEKELQAIQAGKKTFVSNLNPFKDEQGLLRVNGRLSQADIPFDEKFPIILPPKTVIEKKIIEHTHKKLCHAGPQLTLAHLRANYWIVQGKRTTKKIIHQCVRCFRLSPKLSQQIMAPLPSARTTPAKPFHTTGLDYAGPITIKVGPRSRANTKAYIAVFVCMATRAIHLEAVSDLSTAAFLAALRRFIARRGPCRTLQSDNATTFKGAHNELQELQALLQEDQDIIVRELTPQGVSWKFNAPLAPHQGGLWEAGVKSVKFHLRRVMGIATYNFEELVTILCQIEACLNSRPLCPLSEDPSDLAPLTPGHFLLGCSPTALPDANLLDIPINRLDRWQLIQRATWEFWRRWKSEYLIRLQSRPKWLFPKRPMQVNDLVILKDDNLPPLQWRLGRITAVHPGHDGMVRNVTVTTGKSSFTRAVQALALLPINADQDTDSDEDI